MQTRLLLALGASLLFTVVGARSASAQLTPAQVDAALHALETQLHAPQSALIGRPTRLPDGRAVIVAAVRRARGDQAGQLVAVLVAQRAGAAALDGTVVLPAERAERLTVSDGSVSGDNGDVRVLQTTVSDFDDDTEPEVRIVMEYTTTASPAVGYSRVRHVFFLDVVPALTLAAAIESTDTPQADVLPLTRGTVLNEDTNADGHRDLVWRWRSCEMPEGATARRCGRNQRTVYVWQQTDDTWRRTP